jgi:hypothetical protein
MKNSNPPYPPLEKGEGKKPLKKSSRKVLLEKGIVGIKRCK